MTTLFLKYRPQNFDDIVGQTAVVKTLKNAIKNGRAAHAYLFVGSRGTGKTSSARIFAKAINSFDPQTGDVVETELTRQIAAGDCVDIIEIDAASHTGVDNIRDLIDKTHFLPTYANKKVYIIDEVHMLSKGAFNALLKTLEEPPEHTYFVLATTELHKVPDTIVSRCQTFTFGRFTIEQMVDRLQKVCKAEKITAETSALEIIAKKAEGGLRDAISLLEQIAAEADNQITESITRQTLGISNKETLELFWTAINDGQTQAGLNIITQIRQNGTDLRMFGHDFLRFLQTQMKASLNSPTLPKILQTIEVIEQALQRLKTSPILELPLEIAVIKMGQQIDNAEIRSEKVATKHLSSSEKIEKKSVPTPHIKKSAPVTTVETPPIQSLPQKNIPEKVVAKKSAPTLAPNNSDVSTPNAQRSTSAHKNSNSELPTVTEIQNELGNIAEEAGLQSFVKKSFLTCIPKVNGSSVEFGFTSMFHFEQLDKTAHKQHLREAMKTIFGCVTEVQFALLKSTRISPEQAQQPATLDDLEF